MIASNYFSLVVGKRYLCSLCIFVCVILINNNVNITSNHRKTSVNVVALVNRF